MNKTPTQHDLAEHTARPAVELSAQERQVLAQISRRAKTARRKGLWDRLKSVNCVLWIAW